MKQCEKAPKPSNYPTNPILAISAVAQVRKNNRKRENGKRSPSNSALKRFPCHECKKYGHWENDQNSDGSLKTGAKVFYTAEDLTASLSPDSKATGNSSVYQRKYTVTFNMATLIGSSVANHHYSASRPPKLIAHGPLVDDGAPYSALGIVELKMIREQLKMFSNLNLDEIPESLNGYMHWQYGDGSHAISSRLIMG